jgi:hypothetical protein
MKKILTLLALSTITYASHAQSCAEYTYDQAGNRIRRQIMICSTNTGAQPRSATTTQSVEESLAIKDEGAILINLYPNPTQSDVNITIDYQNVPQQEVTMSLYDASGKLLESKQVNSTQHQISLQNYPTGIYYLRMSSLENKTMKEVKILRD